MDRYYQRYNPEYDEFSYYPTIYYSYLNRMKVYELEQIIGTVVTEGHIGDHKTEGIIPMWHYVQKLRNDKIDGKKYVEGIKKEDEIDEDSND